MNNTKYTNNSNVSLALAVWLSTDTYDYDPGTISATGLMRPLRQKVLAPRVPQGASMTDLIQMVKSRMGTALHDSIEKAWTNPVTRPQAIRALGYPDSVANRIVVNPEGFLRDNGYTERSLKDLYMEADKPNMIPVFMEIRNYLGIGGYTVSGKFDFVAEGRVRDFKSTGTFTYVNETKTDDYRKQGSIYRMLNPAIVKDDVMATEFIFPDWAAYNLKSQKGYPPAPIMAQHHTLWSLEETEQYVLGQLKEFDHWKSAHEQDLPHCNDKELWRKDDTYKYYAKGVVGPRSTKNFDNKGDAYEAMTKAGKGIVVEVKGAVTACKFCPAFAVCTQKDMLIADGSLDLTS